MKNQSAVRFISLTGIVLAAGLARFLPHPWNFAPVAAMAMFGGAYFTNRLMAIVLPLITLWLSDLVLDNIVYSNGGHFSWFYEGFYWQYIPVVLTTLISMFSFRKVNMERFVMTSLASALLFFVVSNFGVWLGSAVYPQNFTGMAACYVAALPFFAGTLAGNIVYGAIFFGGFELAGRRFPQLKKARV